MSQTPWWQSAVIYQIYPKSFQDSGARGTGDLKGIMARLDYLKTLGVDALWLTPVYVSPQVDNGYDIADYYQIEPAYGTMADFEALLAAAHARDIRIVMDIVVNHTSTEHAWFKSALGDKNSPYRDYYIWKDPVDGGVPNNWQSKFGGSAWELDAATGQYYLHLFAREQADLNWENPLVRAEVKNIIHFWAGKGVDGFRLDVINLISKDQTFPNDDVGDGRRFYTDGPRIHEFLQDVSRDVFAPVGAMTVGEMSSTSLEHCQRYGALDGSELSMVFNFHHLKVDYPNGDKWTKAPFDFLELKRIFNHWQSGMHGKGWSALFWCNHDQPRIVSRFGDEGEHRVAAAKMLASTLHGLQGTPYIYQGEEIGMTNPGYQSIDDYQDVESRNIFAIK
ncbi:MAG: alpha,alpha-phosphotrehalase, partial [Aeromonas salmonicida]